MQWMPRNAATRRYTLRVVPAMILYALAVFGVAKALPRYHLTGTAAYLLAILPALPILSMIISVGLYLSEERDEFQRNLFIQSMVWAIGATLSVTTVWGSLEMFAQCEHLSLFWLFPMYWTFAGLAVAALQVRYR